MKISLTPFCKGRSRSGYLRFTHSLRLLLLNPMQHTVALLTAWKVHGAIWCVQPLVPVMPSLHLKTQLGNEFLPALTGRSAITDQERELLSLPCRLGGLGIPDFTKLASSCYQASQDICSPVVDLILKSKQAHRKDTSTEQRRIKQRVKNEKRVCDADKGSSLDLPDRLMKEAELAQNKGSSSWLTALPLVKYHFSLSKSEFRDAICMQYGWLPRKAACQMCL